MTSTAKKLMVELITYDPTDEDTYPSICPTPEDVARRFGFNGGETLVFDDHGSYLGELTKQLP